MSKLPPVRIEPETVLNALGWFIKCELPQYAAVRCRQRYTPDGVVLEPIGEDEKAKERE